jgi:transcriptional regulator with XRE-family HTH domain
MMKQHLKEMVGSFGLGDDLRPIAETLRMSEVMLKRLINGRKPVDETFLSKLKEAFPVNINYIFNGEGSLWTDESFDPQSYFAKKEGGGHKLRKGINPSVCERVRMIRKELNLTQAELAYEIKTERHIVSSIESERQNPTIEFMFLLWDAFSVNLNYVVTGVGQRYLGKSEAIDQESYNQAIKDLKQSKTMIEILTDKVKELTT